MRLHNISTHIIPHSMSREVCREWCWPKFNQSNSTPTTSNSPYKNLTDFRWRTEYTHPLSPDGSPFHISRHHISPRCTMNDDRSEFNYFWQFGLLLLLLILTLWPHPSSHVINFYFGRHEDSPLRLFRFRLRHFQNKSDTSHRAAAAFHVSGWRWCWCCNRVIRYEAMKSYFNGKNDKESRWHGVDGSVCFAIKLFIYHVYWSRPVELVILGQDGMDWI